MSEGSILLLPEMRLHEVPLTTWLTDHMIIVTLVTSQGNSAGGREYSNLGHVQVPKFNEAEVLGNV